MDDVESTVMPFGKHRGEEFGQILADDPTYFRWLRDDADITSPRLRQAIEDMCARYEREIDPDID